MTVHGKGHWKSSIRMQFFSALAAFVYFDRGQSASYHHLIMEECPGSFIRASGCFWRGDVRIVGAGLWG